VIWVCRRVILSLKITPNHVLLRVSTRWATSPSGTEYTQGEQRSTRDDDDNRLHSSCPSMMLGSFSWILALSTLTAICSGNFFTRESSESGVSINQSLKGAKDSRDVLALVVEL
jgi:hypothetical protein